MKGIIPSSTSHLRVAAYCRIAGGGGQNDATEVQRAYYTEQINAHPDWTMAGIYIDTSDHRSKTPEFQKMLRKCRQKEVDLILVKSVSRFARNTLDCLKYIRILRELDVAVIFEKENINTSDINSDWNISVMGSFAQAEIESIPRGICAGCFRRTKESGRGKGPWKKTDCLPTFLARMSVRGRE